jgi:peptidylprolyl isomerase
MKSNKYNKTPSVWLLGFCFWAAGKRGEWHGNIGSFPWRHKKYEGYRQEINMTQAKEGNTVKIHYTGRLQDGTEFDSSSDREPLQFNIGSGQVIPGFEEAVTGMRVGEKKTAQIPCDKAYGKRDPSMVMVVDRKHVPAEINPEVGQRLQVGSPNGQLLVVTVIEISHENITLDANPPLAGEDLTFDIELVEIA